MPQLDPMIPHAHDPGTVSLPTPDEPPEASNDTDQVVSQWQLLGSMDQQHPDFLPLLLPLIKGTDQCPTTKLRDADARITLGTLVEVGHLLLRGIIQAVSDVVPSARCLGKGKSRLNMSVTLAVSCERSRITLVKLPHATKSCLAPSV